MSTQLTTDGVSLYPQTDGVRVAWQTATGTDPTTPPLNLTTLDLSTGTTSVLSSSMSRFHLAAGVLAWLDQTYGAGGYIGGDVTTQALRASDGMSTTTLSNLLGTTFFGSSGGYVVFEETSKLYGWSPSGGRTLLFDAAPGQLLLAGKTVYFTNGNNQTLYAVTLP